MQQPGYGHRPEDSSLLNGNYYWVNCPPLGKCKGDLVRSVSGCHHRTSLFYSPNYLHFHAFVLVWCCSWRLYYRFSSPCTFIKSFSLSINNPLQDFDSLFIVQWSEVVNADDFQWKQMTFWWGRGCCCTLRHRVTRNSSISLKEAPISRENSNLSDEMNLFIPPFYINLIQINWKLELKSKKKK